MGGPSGSASGTAAALSLLDQMAVEQAMQEQEDELLLLQEAGRYDPAALALIEAAEAGEEAAIRAMLEAGATPVDSLGPAGTTALMEAASHGHAGVLAALLEHSARTGTADAIGWTALHFAAYNGNLIAVQALLSAGADADARSLGDDGDDTGGQTALELALDGCSDETACPRRRYDRREVASFLLRASGLSPDRIDEAIGQLPDIDLSEGVEQLEDIAADAPALDEAAAAELELQELEMQLELEELEAELTQQEIEAEELQLQLQIEDEDEEEGEGEGQGEEEEDLQPVVSVTPGDFRMQSFYALPLPSAECDAPAIVWAEPLLPEFYAAGREVRCRDDDALLATVVSSTAAPPTPIRRLILNSSSRVSTAGLTRFATEVRHLQEIGVWHHRLEIIAEGCGPWTDGELGALRGVALSKLDISGMRRIAAADVACLAAGIRSLQHQGRMGRDFALVARGCDWGPGGEALLAWCGVTFGVLDMSRFTRLSFSSMKAFFRNIAVLQRAGEMTTAFVLIARYCDWAPQGSERDNAGLLMGLAQAGVAFASIDLSSAQHLGAAALREFSAETAKLQQLRQERASPCRQAGSSDDGHDSVRMSQAFEFVARFCDWEPGELEALCHCTEDAVAATVADAGAAQDAGSRAGRVSDQDADLVLGSTRARGLSLSLLDISGATSVRLREVIKLTRALWSTQRHQIMQSSVYDQSQGPPAIALTLKATDCNWSGGLFEPWGSVLLKSVDISNGTGLTLGDVHAFGTRLLATQVEAQAPKRHYTVLANVDGLPVESVTGVAERVHPDLLNPLALFQPLELIAKDCERTSSDVDWTQEQNTPSFANIVGREHLDEIATAGDDEDGHDRNDSMSSTVEGALLRSPAREGSFPSVLNGDGGNKVIMEVSLSEYLQRKGMSNWLGPLQEHLRLETASQLRGLEVADLQRLALLSGWTLTDTDQQQPQQQWQKPQQPEPKPQRHGAQEEAMTPRTTPSVSEQLVSLEREMEEATAAGDYDRLAPLANLWGRLARPTKQSPTSSTVGRGGRATKSGQWNWNSFSTVDLQKIHSVLVADLDDEIVTTGETAIPAQDACEDDTSSGVSATSTTNTCQQRRDESWVHEVLRCQVGLDLASGGSSGTISSSANCARGTDTNDTVRRAFQFERKSIGEELSIAAALGVLPGGVEAIDGRRGPQATQGTSM